MLKAPLIVVVVFLASLTQLAAELWTNQASRVIEGTLKDFDGAWVTLVRTNGMALRLPLSVLCASDQRRVLLQSARSIAPDFVQAAYKDARSVLDRFESLPAHQQTSEGRKRAVLMACSVFDTRIKTRAAELQEKALQDEVQRLRLSFANSPKD
jgi:hypothetical protein